MVEVLENLYIGDKIDAYRKDTLQRLNIKYIVNCAKEVENRFENEKDNPYEYYSIRADESGQFQMITYFNSSSRFIQEGIDKKTGVLVHCAYGRNRSATVIIAYLLKYKQMDLNKAIEFLADKRPEIAIQQCNQEQLQKYYEYLNKKQCCSIF